MTDALDNSALMFRQMTEGDADSTTELFERYLTRLCRLARTRMSARLQQRIDPEDVVMSAWRSFFIRSREGKFCISESGQIWSLLATITLRKLYRSAAHHNAERRSMARECGGLVDTKSVDLIVSESPSPEEAVAMADEVEALLAALPASHRRVVELRLQGELIDAIARETELSERTVRRILDGITKQLTIRQAESGTSTIRVLAGNSQTKEISQYSLQTQPALRKSTSETSGPTPVKYSDFILERLIGRGGMGKVFQARLRSTNELLAVKFLHRRFQFNEAMSARLLNEARVGQQIQNDGILCSRSVGQTPSGIWYLVMPYVKHTTLARILMTAPPNLSAAIQWMKQLVEAMLAVHSAGVVHCDLKPDNVLISENNMALVSDFGLCHMAGMHCEDEIVGTVFWMAPEQIDPVFGDISHQTDVYGLGAVLHAMLTTKPPFSGDKPADVFSQIVSAPPWIQMLAYPKELAKHETDTFISLRKLCLQCLHKHPKARINLPALRLRLMEIEEQNG
ncbi:MAG: protein kinase [Planctomycetaceae bacterium]|nr:protein kinase [Planctomycetaceae bacterium]